MRRYEYFSDDMTEYDAIMAAVAIGYLGIETPDGYPRVVPVDFVTMERVIYFHGATAGEKYEVLVKTPKVTFSADIPYSVIPSYWISPESAGGATRYFKSVLIRGQGLVVSDQAEKCRALQAILDKYQPEGGFVPVTPKESLYHHLLKSTAVFRIDAEQIDIKIKFPKDKPEAFRRMLVAKLTARAQGSDLATAREIEKSLSQ
jgi:nitroimidazol reductase NimA-like FMN-containing flavoprotein (pyridoxamine 5'-phosphate oxidase superfamily)